MSARHGLRGISLALVALLWACSDDSGTPTADMGPTVDTGGVDMPWTYDGQPPAGDTGTTKQDGNGPSPDQGGPSPDSGTPSVEKWVTVTAGTFKMGSPASEPCRGTDEAQHDVTLTKDFEIGAYEVTQAEYQAKMGNNPSNDTSCGTDCPVESVTWHMAADYCNKLSQDAGKTPCYTCTGTGKDTACENATAYAGDKIYSCPGYRLPTEAEWEYAYRAGTTTALYSGAFPTGQCNGSFTEVDTIAWYIKNSNTDLHPVGGKTPNAWKIYDMAGNVAEWVQDYRKMDLGTAAVTNPVITDKVSQSVIRGGHFAAAANRMRGADRQGQTMTSPGTGVGFRVVRTLNP